MPSIICLSDISSRSDYDRLKRTFQCSNTQLQNHIIKHAYADQKRGLFHTYFYVDNDNNYLGYISITAATIQRELITDEIDIPEAMKYSIPAIKVTRLCTFDDYCNNGIGKTLMILANVLAVVQQKTIGCRALIVDSKPEAVSFYEQFDFVELINKTSDSDTTTMLYDIGKLNELEEEDITEMISFCRTYNQTHLIDILKK